MGAGKGERSSVGERALSELRKLAKADDPRVRFRAKNAIGRTTGHRRPQVDLTWSRSMKDSIGKGKLLDANTSFFRDLAKSRDWFVVI